MFVGASGFTYRNGGAAILLFTMAGPAYLLGFFLYGPLWRRTRIDTPMEFLTRRYSPGTTYTYTLLSIVPNVLTMGISIYTLCIFVTAALGFGDHTIAFAGTHWTALEISMLVTGVVLVSYTLIGGLWAVMVTDSLQFIVLLAATLVVFPLAFMHVGSGSFITGFSEVLNSVPDGFLGFKLSERPGLFWVAYGINTVLGYNVNWHIAQRYYSIADERDTRKMALWCAGLSLVLPLLWILPVMASKVIFPDLAAMWPGLAEPTEGAFVSLALEVLPHGLLGIIVAAMFAATMSSADTVFNWLAAVVTKDAAVPLAKRIADRDLSERDQLIVGKAAVAAMGMLAIWIAFSMQELGGVFDVQLKASSLYSAPMFIPVLLGLVWTRTPWWSGLVSLFAGVIAVVGSSLLVNAAHGLPVDSFAALFLDVDIQLLGLRLTRYEIQMLSGTVASTGVFCASMLVRRRRQPFQGRIEALERDLATPARAQSGPDAKGPGAIRLLGGLSACLGLLLLLAAGVTFGSMGWEVNLYVGLAMAIMGLTIRRLAKSSG